MIEIYPGMLVNLGNIAAANFHGETLILTFIGGEKMRFSGVPAQHGWDQFSQLVNK